MKCWYNSGGDYLVKIPRTRKDTKSYVVWNGMVRRCHYKNHQAYKYYGGRGVSVCGEWLDYQNFAKWYCSLGNYGKGYHLDKDLIDFKNTEYTPDFCCLIPREVNALFTGGCKVLVPYNKIQNKWSVCINIGEKCAKGNRKQTYFGYYSDQQEALAVYFKHKIAHVKDVASRYKNELDERVFANLNNDQWIKDYIYHLSALTNKEH